MSAKGNASPGAALNIQIATPRADASEAALAARIVPARIGRGASTRTSRRLGKIESQLSTANTPVTSMVVAIRACSGAQAETSTACHGFLPLSRLSAMTPNGMLIQMRVAAKFPRSLFASPRA